MVEQVKGKTVLEALVRSLETTAKYNPNDVVHPYAILWTDHDSQWLPIIPQLRRLLPQLLTFGEYQPEQRIGPAIWLRSVVDRALPDVEMPEGIPPIVYLPDVSRQELREEHKEMEGRPEVRARIRQLQRERGRRRMMEQVPLADVVLTNPTHYAIALRYDAERMRAPVVVAKGTGLIALRIRAIAAEHGVPVLESAALARALYPHAALDQPIPVDLYLVVAQVLAHVYQVKHQPHQAPVPPEFEVPAGYRVAPEAAAQPADLSAADEARGGAQG